MKHTLPFLLCAIVFGDLNAQPVLDLGNSAPVPGESFVVHACALQSSGNAGAGQTWDLSSLTTDSVIDLAFVDPDSTADGFYFPPATVADPDPAGTIYYVFNAAGGRLVGTSIPGSTPISYDNPMITATYPCTYLTSWHDSIEAAYNLGGYAFDREGSITATADGYGTLIMPYGQVSDVLRVTYVEDYSDHSLLTAHYHREYTHFFQAGTHNPIVSLFSYSRTIVGMTQTTTGSQWLEVATTSVAENTGPVDGLNVWPLPAKDEITVRFDSHASACSMEMIDVLGQVVLYHDVITPTTGTHDEHLTLEGLKPALYTLRIRQGEHETCQRIVVE